ncbi:hypothetical protein Ddye_013708 [Dipteronia dyeriana]|uniref:KIB1-4 beta-propeller domain-containing protein n=1 Tax=Dipteronia dyeriana TaxID=168575 RepID=A0AAD9X6X9_9ROSI|nr:hypothetical protein Ddye_013708 [Dipteronia dyeriana]
MSTPKKKKKMKMEKKADWIALDDLVLEEIAGRIALHWDFVAFRMVCTSWRYSLRNFKWMPWLMLPPKQGNKLNEFFIFPQVQAHGITQQHLAIPETDFFPQEKVHCIVNQLFRGLNIPSRTSLTFHSSKGWLIDIEIFVWPRSLSLLHSFSGTQIKLPQWPNNLNACFQKFILSSNPLFTSNYTVMILHGGERRDLIYSKPGDEAWTTINTGKFYIVSMHCRIMAYECDVTGDNPTMAQVANLPESLLQEDLWDEVYILESSGRRLLVVTQIEWHWHSGRKVRGKNNETNYGIYEFQVFEVDLSTNNCTETKDLGNKTLFLGSSSSICIESDGVYSKPNRIFFMEYYNNLDAVCLINTKGTHVRIYNIEDVSRNIESYFSGDPCGRLTPPLFVEQCLY